MRWLALPLGLVIVAGASQARAQNDYWAERADWSVQTHVQPQLRVALLPTYGFLSGEQRSYAGPTLAVGYESLFSIHPALNRWFYGSAMGLEARIVALRSVDRGDDSWIVAGGLAFSSYVLPRARAVRGLRFASMFSLFLPEGGFVWREPEPKTFSLRFSAPAGWLVAHSIAVEIAPAMTFLTHTPSGRMEILWGLAIGASWRQLGPLPRDI